MTRIYLSPPDVRAAERAFVADAFDSNWVAPLGPHVDAFEDALAATCGVKGAAALSSGTAAIHLALLLAGVEPGGEVMCASFTFAASVNPVRYVGAEPILVDSDATWTIDPDLVVAEFERRARSGRLPKALIAVDLYGQCADYERLEALCAEYGATLIEDAAEALGATAYGQPAGSFGDYGILSFNGNKIITTSGGGALLSNDPAALARARYFATQAREPAPHYEHTEIGFNYRMSNICAAIGRGQLQTLDERVAARRANFDAYVAGLSDLPGITFMPEAPYGRGNRWLTTLTIDPAAFGATREEVRKALEAEDIESRPVWKPMHLQPLYRDAKMIGGGVSARIFEQGLCLPSGSSLTAAERDRVIEAVRSQLRN
jgi:pyridoxal phosphate-dependent aminotransferase EpsN